MKYHFSTRSIDRLQGVDIRLVALCWRALYLSPHDFGITEGLRDIETQRRYVADGKSWTMNSKHLTGHAIDFAVWLDGEWNWDFEYYRRVSEAFKQAAEEYDIEIVWGGGWEVRDGPHIELVT